MNPLVPRPSPRRTFLHLGAAFACGSLSGPLGAQTAGLDRQSLDDAFDMPKAAPNLPQITRRYATGSDAVRRRLGEPQRHAYGPTAIEALDLYPARAPKAPIHVFLHGGAFNLGSARNYGFPAETFVRAGAHFVVPDFMRAQDAGGSIVPLLEQVRRAVAWVHRHAASLGGDPDRLYVSGHSSGAELAALVLTTDWRNDHGLPADVVKGGLCCSATYDLKAFRHSAAGAKFSFTDETEHALSARRHVDKLGAPVIIAFGSLETAWFQSQSREFGAAAVAAGKTARLLVGDGYNHFEVIETLANPYGLLGRAALAQMGLGSD